MAGKIDPAFPLYAKDWLTDRPLRRLSRELRATLLDLWAIEWLDGELPDDAEWLAGETRSPVADVEALLVAFFDQTRSGAWISPRLEAERDEREAKRRSRADAGSVGGKRSAEARRAKREAVDKLATGKDLRCGREANAKQSGKQTAKQTRSKAASKLEANGQAKSNPSASASSSSSNLSYVSRIPDSQAQQPSPSARANPITADGTLRPSEGSAGSAGRTDSSQNASDSPVTASGGRKVSTHHPARENAAQGRAGAFNAKPSTRRGTHSVSSVVGGIMRHLEGGAA